MNCNVIGFPFSNGQELARYMNVEQITKADRLRLSRPLRKKQIPRHATAA